MLPDTPQNETPPTADAAPAPADTSPTAPEPAVPLTTEPAEPAVALTAEASPSPTSGPADLSPAACAARLAELFPALFGAGRALPIKLRIQADIQQRAPGIFNKKSLSIFLHRHTTSTAYIRALVQAPHRFDLDGAPAGEVAEEHRAAATAELERRRSIVEARRAAEREAQRQAATTARRAAAKTGPAADGTDAAPGTTAAPAQRPPRPDRPPRVPRAPRQDGHGHDSRPGRSEQPPRVPRPGPENRPPRREQDARPPRPREPRTPMPGAEATPLGGAAPSAVAQPMSAAPAPTPAYSAAELEARRERAALLRTWEQSSLTRANFCVLKRITEAELDAQLALAQKEREQRPERREPRPDPRPEARRDAERPPHTGPGPHRGSGPRR